MPFEFLSASKQEHRLPYARQEKPRHRANKTPHLWQEDFCDGKQQPKHNCTPAADLPP